jgi:hypothetical protein
LSTSEAPRLISSTSARSMVLRRDDRAEGVAGFLTGCEFCRTDAESRLPEAAAYVVVFIDLILMCRYTSWYANM